MKIRPVAAQLFHADRQRDRGREGKTEGRIDMTKLTVAIRKFANATKNVVLLVMVGRSN
jgi:hypothetical protein